MKYVQPHGISDPEASYINGNPSTGTMGSIPPAASIEHPQREIVNFINESSLTPSPSDLFQLAKAVQSGIVNYGLDQGTVNQIVVTPTLPVSAYTLGQRFLIKVLNGNTGAVTVNISGIGGAPLIHTDLTPILAWELKAGQLIEVAYDGANWQAIAGVTTGAVVLTAPRTVYVNDTTGSDTAYDGTSATVSGGNGPFKTIDKALVTMSKYNLGGWNFTIQVADGNYHKTTTTLFPAPNGSGKVFLTGNISNPQNVSIYNTGTGDAWRIAEGGSFQIRGFYFRTTAKGTGDDDGAGIQCVASSMNVGLCRFGACTGAHLLSSRQAACGIGDNITITGNARVHMQAWNSASFLAGGGTAVAPDPGNPAVSILNAVTFSEAFVIASNLGVVRPIYLGIPGIELVTGTRYKAVANGVVDVNGRAGGYLPGTVSGTTATGGQYV